MMTLLRAAIFDFDDTLMATRKSRVAALIRAAADFGYFVKSEDIAKHWGRPFDDLISGIMPGIDYEIFHRHYAAVMRTIPPQALPGAHDLLAELTDHGVRIFIVSSGSRELVRQDLEDGSLWQYVSRLWGFEDTAYRKPDPRTLEPVLLELAKYDVHLDQALYIGDSISDFKVATANGLPFCAVLTGTDRREDFHLVGLQRRFVVDSLQELLTRDGWLLDRLK